MHKICRKKVLLHDKISNFTLYEKKYRTKILRVLDSLQMELKSLINQSFSNIQRIIRTVGCKLHYHRFL